jgi:DegV family protein with EDD domain
MSKVALITDSTAYLPDQYVQQYGIIVAPQILIWGDETFRDGVDIHPDEFYARLKTATVMPSTSQVTIGYFQQLFQDLLDKDCHPLALLVSNKLSGTIDSAVQARAMFPDDAPIEIVDSQTTSMALGLQLLQVARAAENGANLKECKALAEKAREHTGVIFAVDTLEFLHRGGRIGGGSRFMGTALNLKPILEVTGGRVEAVERIRTRSKSLNRLVEMIVERVGDKQPVRLSALHANAEAEARMILEQASQKLNPVETFMSTVSPVVGTHAGPGTVGIAYMAGM